MGVHLLWILPLPGANLISDGSELLMAIPSLAGLVGSVVLPVLGAVPDGMMVLFSGFGENAQEEVAVGVGALAGSSIMLLTLSWTSAMIGGRVDVKDGICMYKCPVGVPIESWLGKLTP